MAAQPDVALDSELLATLIARHQPSGIVEQHHVERLTWAIQKQKLLRSLETRMQARLQAGAGSSALERELRAVVRFREQALRSERWLVRQLARLKARRPDPVEDDVLEVAAPQRRLSAAPSRPAASRPVLVHANAEPPARDVRRPQPASQPLHVQQLPAQPRRVRGRSRPTSARPR